MKTTHIVIRTTEAERELWKRVAQSRNLTLSQVVRECLEREAKKEGKRWGW